VKFRIDKPAEPYSLAAMTQTNPAVIDLVRLALEEDIGRGDITSLACLGPSLIRARIMAKSEGVVSGLIPARMAFETVDSANKLTLHCSDGDRFAPGDTLLEIEGLDRTVLSAERVALNFLAHLSGVATFTSRFVAKVTEAVGDKCRVLDTRKTTPGWRVLEKAAVVHGGGLNHRQGLFDMVLVKDNHIAAAGSITEAVKRAREYLSGHDFRLQFDAGADEIDIEVEVTNESELAEAVAGGVRRLLLDNQSPERLRALVEKARQLDPDVRLEASGNVTLETVATLASCGVDYISIGALTHSAPACDFSMKVIE
jgi:nicotinate-nucleotide pyrophosphorylase (carboxylating)